MCEVQELELIPVLNSKHANDTAVIQIWDKMKRQEIQSTQVVSIGRARGNNVHRDFNDRTAINSVDKLKYQWFIMLAKTVDI